MPFAIALVVLSVAWRIMALYFQEFSNFAPLMALAFCGAVYFRERKMWLVPFVALALSDLYIDHHYATVYGYEWNIAGALVRTACFAAAVGFGMTVARKRTWLNLFGGSLGSSIFFYLVTNTGAWLGDKDYAHNAAGWLQAMTVGHPQFQPTWWFFRNTLISDLAFTAAFVIAMEVAAKRAGRESLLGQRAVGRTT